MATKVELTTRNTRSEIVNEGKSTKSCVIPLSDASNKSSDSSISSSFIIEETIRVPSKPVSMFNTGIKPRLSAKPFTKEKPPESQRTVGMISADVKSESDVPFQTSASISLSGNTKTEDAERVGRRIFTSSYQPDTEEDQLNKSETFSSTILNRKQTSSSWMPTPIGECKSTSEASEPKVTSKPPIMSRKADVLQQHEKVHVGSLRRLSTDATDEQKETPEKAKNNSFQSESMDSSAVRAQLRPKRRPVSAVFSGSVNDQTPDSKVTEKPRLWNRRPLSEDLTSLFESGGLGNKQSIFEEAKENIPLRKSSLRGSFKEDHSTLTFPVGDYNSSRTTSNETRTVGSKISSSRNLFPGRGTDEAISEIRPRTVQERTITTGVDSTVKGAVNDMQDSKALNDYNDVSNSEIKTADDNGVATGTMKSRISRYLANTSSIHVGESVESSEEKPLPTVERKTRTTFADNDVEFGRPQTTSQYQMASISKKFLTSSSNVEPKSEKADEVKDAPTSQDIKVQKETKDWRTSEFLEEKSLRQRRSFRKVEEPLQLQDNAYKHKQYDHKKEDAENYKQPVDLDNTFMTVKATMFEHNVEWHRPPELLLSARNPTSNQPSRSDIFSESIESKPDPESWSKWLSNDSVHAVTQLHKDSDITDIRFSNSRVGKAAPAADHDILQKLKVDEKTRIEPRFEVIQTVGERVSSESIQMAPEDKAVALRSGRSFHRKERVLENSEIDEGALRRPVSNLQRSKSEYRRRDTSSQESSTNNFLSRDLDFPLNRKNSLRAAKSDLIKSPDIRTYETGKNKTTVHPTVSDLRSKSYIQDYKPNKEKASERSSVEQPPFGDSATDSKDMKKSLNDYRQHSHRSFSDSVEKGFEAGKRTVKDEPVGSYLISREDIKTLPHVEVKQSYERNRCLSNKESPATKKENKDESNYLISEMLSNEVEQHKKDSTLPHTRKASDSFLKGRQVKEEYTEHFKWERKEVPVQDKGTSSSGTGNSTDLYNVKYEEYGERKRKQNLSPISPTNSKATYFAVTGLDNKKEKNDSNFESQSSAARSWKSEEYFKRDMRMSTTSESDTSPNKPEAIHVQDDLGTSSAFKDSKTHRNQRPFEDDFNGKPAKSLEKKNVIDLDAIIKRHKQKTILDDKPSRDAKTEQKISDTDLDTMQGSPLKLDSSYRSKAIDIDSLMPDYNANPPKKSVSRNDDHSTSKWERSKSFKESASKSSGNKWRDPSVKHVKTDESYQYETVASWYSSTTTSTTEGVQQDSHKISSSANNLKSLQKSAKFEPYREKGRDEGSQVHSQENQNVVSLDSPQESTINFENYKSCSTWASESPPVVTDRSTLRTVAKTTVVERCVEDSKDDPAALKLHHKISVKTVLTEQRQSPSEGRGPAKASDLIALMLENKEKRMEHHRARHSIPLEHHYEPRSHRQEWHHSESKISSRQLRQEPETVLDLSRRKSLNRQRERNLGLEDHLKQCFSRSSTSNKDTDSLVQDPDRQYGTWSQDKKTEDSCVTDSPSYDNSSRRRHSHSRLSSLSHTETDQHDSITEARDGSLDRCSMDLDSTEGTESTPSEARSADFSFIDQTSVLDSTALKNRVQLSRKSQRRAPSQLQRRSRLLQSNSQLAVIEDTDNLWMYSDSTEEKTEKKEEVEEEEEEKPKRTSVHSPRMPVFPGMDHSTLMAQLRKRQDAESSSESSPQATKSPKSPLPHGTLGVKLLPTPADKQDDAAGESPQWLKELKSKKRQSQYENNS